MAVLVKIQQMFECQFQWSNNFKILPLFLNDHKKKLCVNTRPNNNSLFLCHISTPHSLIRNMVYSCSNKFTVLHNNAFWITTKIIRTQIYRCFMLGIVQNCNDYYKMIWWRFGGFRLRKGLFRMFMDKYGREFSSSFWA